MSNSPKHIGFVVGIFPAASETFIIEQIAGLLDRGLKVTIVSLRRGSHEFAAERFQAYKMAGLVRYADSLSFGAFIRLLLRPVALIRSLNIFKYGGEAHSLRLLRRAAALAFAEPDVWHCHFGKVAVDFLTVREILGLKSPMVTTFYGFDVSQVPRQKGTAFYDTLKASCRSYIVMSEDMKRRVIALGFEPDEISVIPVGIRTGDYPYHERGRSGAVRLATVARLVEKKGIDDLLRALALCKSAGLEMSCDIVGDGPLKQNLAGLASELGVDDMVNWLGFMSQENMVEVLDRADIYVQPSKTAANGDME